MCISVSHTSGSHSLTAGQDDAISGKFSVGLWEVCKYARCIARAFFNFSLYLQTHHIDIGIFLLKVNYTFNTLVSNSLNKELNMHIIL